MEPAMRRSHGIRLASLVVMVLSAIALPEPADAHVQCQGNFQITKYGPIATPYCEEEQIAIVAQSHGWHVSASEVHNDPLARTNEEFSARKPVSDGTPSSAPKSRWTACGSWRCGRARPWPVGSPSTR